MRLAPRLVRRMHLVGLVACGMAFAPAQATGVSWPSVSLRGTLLQVEAGDGTMLSGAQLVGRELLVPSGGTPPLALRIAAVERDTEVPGLFLYQMLMRDDAGGWQPICLPDRDGRRRAIPLPGELRADGVFEADADKLTITCTSGVQGKCLRAGYRFWTAGGEVDPQRLAQFQACTRLYRADYCGDGRGWTEDGMLIDVYDDGGVQARAPGAALAFEAGWSPAGAVCVHHTRVPGKLRLAQLLANCPRLAAAPSGRRCTEARARRLGAIAFNRSAPRPR